MKKRPLTGLSDVALIIPGRHIKENDHNREGRGIPYLTGPSDFTETKAIPSRWTEHPEVLCEPRDLLVTVKGAGVAKLNFAPDMMSAIGRQLMAVRAIPEYSVPEFLFYALRWAESELRSMAMGATVPGLSIPHLANLPIPLPPLPEQRRIAGELDRKMSALAEARAAARVRVEAGEALPGVLLREAFEGIVPLAVGIPKTPAPSGWNWHRLTDLARLESGHTPSRKRPDWWGGDIPWLALPDIRALDGKIAMDTGEKTNPEGIANSSARILPAGTVALSRTASVGYVTIFGRPMCTSQDFVNWVCGDRLLPRFLLHLLRSSKALLLDHASGAVHKTIYMNTVEQFHVCLPDLERQGRIVARLDHSLEQASVILAAARTQESALKALPAALLREVFE